ncbi:MAG TPA: type II toxin-antitoxin system prevent-host-death family antitoxin [Ardenticatenaceae bacterium]
MANELHIVSTPSLDANGEVMLEQAGEPVAVVMSYARYQALQERIEELEDALDSLKVEMRVTTGAVRTMSHDDVWAEVEALEQRQLPS